MVNEVLLPVALLVAVTVWLAMRHVIALLRGEQQIEILRRGATGEGRVVAVQRPCMIDACTRLYFDFTPAGGERPVRVCHVDRRPLGEARVSLPPAGAIVAVRYLPHRPQRAVISKLVRLRAD